MSGTDEIGSYVTVGRQVAERYSQCLCAFISGSLVEGLGNSRSDLDVFVITSGRISKECIESTTVEVNGAQIDVTYAERVRVDTEIWRLQEVYETATDLNDVSVDDRVAMLQISATRLDLAHRIRVGMPVVGADVFHDIHEKFDYDKLAYVLYTRFLSSYQNSAEDAAGAIADADAGTAFLTSRSALGYAIDSYLAACGDTNVRQKWRARKLLRTGNAALLSDYLAAEVQKEVDDNGLLQAAKHRVRLANQIAQRARQRLMTSKLWGGFPRRRKPYGAEILPYSFQDTYHRA
jgi:hypothetical protein